MIISVFDRVENIGYQHFLLFQQCFEKASFPDTSKGVIVWDWVKSYLILKIQSKVLTAVRKNCLKRLWEKQKMMIISTLLLSHNGFLSFQTPSFQHLRKSHLVDCLQQFKMKKPAILSLGKKNILLTKYITISTDISYCSNYL